MSVKKLIFLTVIILFLASCNLPAAKGPVAADSPAAPGVDAVATSVELTTTAKLTEIAVASAAMATATVAPISAPTETPSFTPSPTPCEALVTATTVANIRTGPDTAYGVVGSLPLGGTAKVVGRNDANTWWYIEFVGGIGGHAWIAGSVTTASCLPSVVQVVAAPPLPTAPPTATQVITVFVNPTLPPPVFAMPDLYVSEFTITPSTPIEGQTAHVRIGVYNQGNAAASQFTVLWYGLSTFANPSCSWDIPNKVNAHGGRILECDFVFQSWYPTNKTSLVIVDSSNHVAESDESNNQGTISPFGVAKP